MGAYCSPVSGIRVSRWRWEQVWQIRAKRLAEVRQILGQIAEQWNDALARLRVFVEKDDV